MHVNNTDFLIWRKIDCQTVRNRFVSEHASRCLPFSSGPRRLACHANALPLLDDGLSCEEIAKVLYLDDDTVRGWAKRYGEGGVKGLTRFESGVSASRLSPAQEEALKAWTPRVHLHFTPTSASWLNQVERFFCQSTGERIRRGVFHSVADLEAAIEKYLEQHNSDPKPFVWTAQTDKILEKVTHAKQTLKSLH